MAIEKDIFAGYGNAMYSRVDLDIRKICSQRTISRHAMRYANPPELIIRDEVEGMVLELVQHVAAETVQKIEQKYPSDWKQAFKERWFPKWALKRWPVQYTRIVLQADALYPMISLPEKNPSLKLQTYKYSFVQ